MIVKIGQSRTRGEVGHEGVQGFDDREIEQEFILPDVWARNCGTGYRIQRLTKNSGCPQVFLRQISLQTVDVLKFFQILQVVARKWSNWRSPGHNELVF